MSCNPKFLFRLGLGVLFLAAMCACGKKEKTYHIGVSQCSDDEWRRQMNDEIHREILFHEDADVEIVSANDNSKKQAEDIHYFLEKGVDLLIVAPNEAEAVTPAIRDAYKAGVPVIIFDRNINDTTFTSYIDLDNVAIGKAAGKYASDAHSSLGGLILELKGLTGSTPAEERHRGFQSSLEGKVAPSSILSFPADWNDAPAFQITDSLIHAHPEIKVIYAHNDVMAMAAAKAARKNGRNDIFVIGTDGAPGLGIKAVEDSLIQATFSYPTVGEEAIRLAMQILKGDSVEKITHGPATTLITAENAPFLLSMNNLFKQKTNRIEDLNQKYYTISDQKRSQRVTLYIIAGAALLLLAAVFGLLYFIRQKNRFEKELSDKNKILSDQQAKQKELYHQLDEATKSKLAFFTNVSHDLRTPLALIADPVEKVANENYLDNKDKELMGIVVKNVKILRRMIDQILDFRRYENGMDSIQLSEIDIVEAVNNWCYNFVEFAAKRKIDFSISFRNLSSSTSDEDAPLTSFLIAVDVEKTERILFNLLSNAFKFTPDKGSIKVVVSVDEFDLFISVKDSGSGIAEDEMQKIFDRFYQVDSPRPRGSGIGLSLTKAFVDLMEGEITVKSQPGMGAEFRVRIPIRHLQENSAITHDFAQFDLDTIASPESSISSLPEEKEESENFDSKPLLLVIDDNEDIRALVRMMMESHYRVIEAADGKEGLRLAIKYIPDIIVCDIMMPDMDGLEVTRRLKEERATSHIPILILTACRLDEQRVRSYDSGADAFLSKPFSHTLLHARCEALIMNRRRIYDLFLDGIPENINPINQGNEISAAVLSSSNQERDSSRRLRLELDNDFYRDFMKIVRERFSNEDLSVKDIAGKLGIGAAQLTRKIKALTNSTPVEIIREVRLREARKKLLSTNETVAEISFSCGFSTPQYFARCFKEAFGTTPSELRNTVK